MYHRSYYKVINAPIQPASAKRLHADARIRSRINQFLSLLKGKSAMLLDLKVIRKNLTVCDRCNAGLRMVSIDQICGSVSQAHEFDADFNPLQDYTRERWLSVASALQRGIELPPVILIQIGERYFVKDGHHRISVSRALGQAVIRAVVEVWQLQSQSKS